jgi:hypothetical protein
MTSRSTQKPLSLVSVLRHLINWCYIKCLKWKDFKKTKTNTNPGLDFFSFFFLHFTNWT